MSPRYPHLGGPEVFYKCRVCGRATLVMCRHNEHVLDVVARMEEQHGLMSPGCKGDCIDFFLLRDSDPRVREEVHR